MPIRPTQSKADPVAPARGRSAYPMDSPTTAGNMSDTLTVPVAEALTDAVNAANGAKATEGTSGAILADYAMRYRIAAQDAEHTMSVLRLHKRRGAYYSARFTAEDALPGERIVGLTFAEALERFGVTKSNGDRLTTTTAQYRDANVFEILATLRPHL